MNDQKNVKQTLKSLLVGTALFAPLTCFADYYTRTGEVEYVRAHSKSIVGENTDWVALKGIDAMGSCRVTGDGFVVLRLADDMDRAYSTALAAQMSGKKVQVNVNDVLKDSSGACWVRWLNIVN